LMVGCAMLGVNMWVVSPNQFPVSPKYLRTAHALAKKTGAEIKVFHEIPEKSMLKRVNIVYTDEWESMHMHLDKKKLKPILSPLQVNEKLLSHCAKNAMMMHCLPALKGEEVSPTVMYGKKSLVWEQARNRMYVQMALLSCIIR
ncbi:MAG: ornithine carbamoyltransferase, partial [archaeon]